MALTDEMQNCIPKPIAIRTESIHRTPAHSTRIVQASIIANNDHSISETLQNLPQTDDCAKFIVAPVRNKRVAIKIVNTTDCHYTVTPNTNLVELQILIREEMKSIRPVDIAALNLLSNHDDVRGNRGHRGNVRQCTHASRAPRRH